MRAYLSSMAFGSAWAAGPCPNGLARTPPMGWMSWEIFRCQTDCVSHPNSCIDHNLYEQMTDSLVEHGYLDAGYNQVSVDDCWENRAGRDSDGLLVPDPDRFPKGMKALGDYMHSRGVLFGFYSALGEKTCGGFPGTKGHIEDDANTFASWGVDYLKMDACIKNHSELAGYPAMGTSLQATGRNISYSCSWPACLGDDESKKPFGALIDAGCNSWRNWVPDIQCSWTSLSSTIDHFGDYGEVLQPWAGPGHWHDMDQLLVGNDCVTIDEQRTQMAIWCITASPLIMGNDLRSVPDDSRAILLNKDAIAVNQDPLGRMGIRHPRYTRASSTQVWYRELAHGDVAVALYNKGNVTYSDLVGHTKPSQVPGEAGAADISLHLYEVGFGIDEVVSVYDIWSRRHVGDAAGTYVAKSVPPHGTSFLRLSRQVFV